MSRTGIGTSGRGDFEPQPLAPHLRGLSMHELMNELDSLPSEFDPGNSVAEYRGLTPGQHSAPGPRGKGRLKPRPQPTD